MKKSFTAYKKGAGTSGMVTLALSGEHRSCSLLFTAASPRGTQAEHRDTQGETCRIRAHKQTFNTQGQEDLSCHQKGLGCRQLLMPSGAARPVPAVLGVSQHSLLLPGLPAAVAPQPLPQSTRKAQGGLQRGAQALPGAEAHSGLARVQLLSCSSSPLT